MSKKKEKERKGGRNLDKILTGLQIALFILLVLLIGIFDKVYQDNRTITYDQLIIAIENNEVSEIQAKEDSKKISAKLKTEELVFTVIPDFETFTAIVMEKHKEGENIKFNIIQKSELNAIILPMLPGILTIVFLWYLIAKKLPNIGEEENKIRAVSSSTTFEDVAGIDEEKEQLCEVVEFLKKPEVYASMGAKIPKGILLNGEPGTGKTLLAKAIAGEAGVPFIEVNGSSFDEKFVGVGASRVRKLFKEAKRLAPCIIFIDELDSVARSRYNDKSYNEQTLNQLLAEMDGFESRDNIVVIAATNHIEVLDSAIVRPGRFDRQITIPKPDVIAREKILGIYAKNKKLASDVLLKEVAKRTVGFSGADLENVLNEAAIYAVNQNKEVISKSDIDEAIARVLVGLEKKHAAITDEDKRLAAVHEAGHAIISATVRPNVKNLGISIIPRGNAGGYNFFDEADKTFKRKKNLEEEIQVLYGGRIAEELVFSDISTGASNDLERASQIAYQMVSKFAMDDGLLVKIQNQSEYNEQLDRRSSETAEKICSTCYKKAKKVLEEHREQLLKLAEILYEKEYLSQEEVEQFVKANLIK